MINRVDFTYDDRLLPNSYKRLQTFNNYLKYVLQKIMCYKYYTDAKLNDTYSTYKIKGNTIILLSISCSI